MITLTASVCIDAPAAVAWAQLARLEDIQLWSSTSSHIAARLRNFPARLQCVDAILLLRHVAAPLIGATMIEHCAEPW